MKNTIITLLVAGGMLASPSIFVSAQETKPNSEPEQPEAKPELSLITETPEEGFQLAVSLARKSVTTIQKDKKILFEQREIYAKDAEFLIAASNVIATYFQTVSAANDYWRKD